MDTWTHAALSSEAHRVSGVCWRVVEAQHVVSTMALVDTVAEQQLLEELLDASKPPVPPECRHLHYLLSTPFRYGAAYPGGSRFRRPGFTPGVFYASVLVSTAIAEMAFHRLRFFAESPDTPWPATAGEYTAFSVTYRAARGLDLDRGPLARDTDRWRHPADYTACQDLADSARAADVQVIRYGSARVEGRNVALLTCRAFTCREPVARQVWRIQLDASGARAICAFPPQRLGFDRAALLRGV